MNSIKYWQRFSTPPEATKSAHADLIGHDFFCGFGGFTFAAHWVQGVRLKVINAINHNPVCIDVHQTNNPDTEHHCVDMTDSRQFEPAYLPKADFALFSPECKCHSITTGVKQLIDWDRPEQLALDLYTDEELDLTDRNRRWAAMTDEERQKALFQAERSRLTMAQVVRITAHHKYQFFIVENVVDVCRWRHFRQWRDEIRQLGYKIVSVFVNSMFFGVPQSRDRVFFFCYQQHLPDPDLNWHPLSWCRICQRDVEAIQTWKKAHQQTGKFGKHAQYQYFCPNCRQEAYPYVQGAESIINWTLPIHTVGQRNDPTFCKTNRVKPLTEKTRVRIGAGLKALSASSIVDTAYSQAGVAGKVKGTQQPLFTQTSRQTAALVASPGLMVTLRGKHPQNSLLTNPVSTLTTANHHAVMTAPQILSYYSRQNAIQGTGQPIGTITPEPRHALLTPLGAAVMTYHGKAGWHPLGLPLTTQTTKERHCLILPSGTSLDLDEPEQLEQAIDACGFRMLTWQEALLGMGFPTTAKLTNNRRLNFFGLGQAVTPPVVPWMIERAIAGWQSSSHIFGATHV